MIRKKNKLGLFLVPICLVILLVVINHFSTYKVQFSGYYSTKIWGHRANDLERLKLGQNYFNGLEIDLVYIDSLNILDVNHPPAKSINLSFSNYLTYIKNKKTKLWLDIKNLTPSNSDAIFTKIDNELKLMSIEKGDVLIESRYPSTLSVFINSGYQTSYYLPYFNALDENKKRDTLIYIKKILQLQPEIGVSSNFSNYSIMEKEFPKKDKYIWILGNSSTFKSFFDVRKVLKDDSVKIVLVSY